MFTNLLIVVAAGLLAPLARASSDVIGASVVTVAVRNGAPGHIRRATQSDLLAPVAL
jgi:hypothetical protein